jgi:hypothetical protein
MTHEQNIWIVRAASDGVQPIDDTNRTNLNEPN